MNPQPPMLSIVQANERPSSPMGINALSPSTDAVFNAAPKKGHFSPIGSPSAASPIGSAIVSPTFSNSPHLLTSPLHKQSVNANNTLNVSNLNPPKISRVFQASSDRPSWGSMGNLPPFTSHDDDLNSASTLDPYKKSYPPFVEAVNTESDFHSPIQASNNLAHLHPGSPHRVRSPSPQYMLQSKATNNSNMQHWTQSHLNRVEDVRTGSLPNQFNNGRNTASLQALDLFRNQANHSPQLNAHYHSSNQFSSTDEFVQATFAPIGTQPNHHTNDNFRHNINQNYHESYQKSQQHQSEMSQHLPNDIFGNGYFEEQSTTFEYQSYSGPDYYNFDDDSIYSGPPGAPYPSPASTIGSFGAFQGSAFFSGSPARQTNANASTSPIPPSALSPRQSSPLNGVLANRRPAPLQRAGSAGGVLMNVAKRDRLMNQVSISSAQQSNHTNSSVSSLHYYSGSPVYHNNGSAMIENTEEWFDQFGGMEMEGASHDLASMQLSSQAQQINQPSHPNSQSTIARGAINGHPMRYLPNQRANFTASTFQMRSQHAHYEYGSLGSNTHHSTNNNQSPGHIHHSSSPLQVPFSSHPSQNNMHIPATNSPISTSPIIKHSSRVIMVHNCDLLGIDTNTIRNLFGTHGGPVRSMSMLDNSALLLGFFDLRHAQKAMSALNNKTLPNGHVLELQYHFLKDASLVGKDSNQGTLVIFNLDPAISNAELLEVFGRHGEIKEIRESPNRKHKFIEFYDVRCAEKAMKILNKTDLHGRKIKIEPSRPGGSSKPEQVRRGSVGLLPTHMSNSIGNALPSNVGGRFLHPSHNSNGFTNSSPVLPSMDVSSLLQSNHTTESHLVSNSGFTSSQPSFDAYLSPTAATRSSQSIYHSSTVVDPNDPSSGSNHIQNGKPDISRLPISTDNAPEVALNAQALSPLTSHTSDSLNTPLSSPLSALSSPPRVVSSNEPSPSSSEASSPRKDSGFMASENAAEMMSSQGKAASSSSASLVDHSNRFDVIIPNVLNGADTRTTLMIKNIPNKYDQDMLLLAVNKNHVGNYDFFYLPIDFKNRCNVGYAFINFIDPKSIPQFYEEFNSKRWEKFNSEKVCKISYARIQGKISMVEHFKNSSLMFEDPKCRPLIFHSDGTLMGKPEPFPVGPNVRPRSRKDSGNATQKELQLNPASTSSQAPTSPSPVRTYKPKKEHSQSSSPTPPPSQNGETAFG